MSDKDAQSRFLDFLVQARDYAQTPGVMAGLALDEASVRLRQVALSELKDVELGRHMEQLLKLIRHQDTKQMPTLLDRVESLLAAHRRP